MEEKTFCHICTDLEKGSTLYTCNFHDFGMDFTEINNIEYCPKCGRRLLTYEEKEKKAEATMRKICKQILEETEGD